MKIQNKSKVFLLLINCMFFNMLHADEYSDNSDEVKVLPNFDCLIEPSEIVDIGSPARGIIEKVFAGRGDYVELGSPLSTLNSSVEKAALELARTRASSSVEIDLSHENAEFSKRRHSRNKALFNQSAISSHEMDRLATEQSVAEMHEKEAINRKKIALLEYRRALEVLNQRTIVSPIKGVVMEKYKSAGEYVENEPLMRVAQLDPLHIEIIVEADYWGRLIPGQQAKVTPEFTGIEQKVATIERIDPVVDSASGTFRVQLRLPNPENKIAAGLKCQLVFIQQKTNVNTVKIDDLSPEGGSTPESSKIESETVFLAPQRGLKQSKAVSTADSASVIDISDTRLKAGINGYYVHSLNLAGRGKVKAFTRRLKTEKVSDFYVKKINKTQSYRVALGLYQKLRNAMGRVEKLKSLGFEVEIKPHYKACITCEHQSLITKANSRSTRSLRVKKQSMMAAL